jgi:hypothetical protein
MESQIGVNSDDKLKEMRDILAEYKYKIIEEFAVELEKRLANNPYITMAGYQSILADIYHVQKKLEGNKND